MTLAALYSAWAGGTENIFEIFHFYPFGVPTAPTVLGVGGNTHPKFGMEVGLSSILDKFALFSDKAPQFKNTAVRRRSGWKFGPKFGKFCHPCKKGANMGRMSVDIL